MATQTLAGFEKALAAGRVPRVVLFAGEEARLADHGLARLREAVVPEPQRAFDEERLRADEVDVARLLDSLRTLPAFGARRLVILRDAHRLEEKGRGNEALREALEVYVASPLDTTVFALAAGKVDRRLKVWKAVERAGVVVDCSPPDEATLPQRLEEVAEATGTAFEPGAARLLVDLAGGDLGVLEGEVAKLAAYVGPGARITERAVHDMLDARRGGEGSVFAWVDTVAEGRTDAALLGLDRLLAAGEEPLRLLALLARQLRLVWSARALLDRGAGLPEVEQSLPPQSRWLARKLVAQARRVADADLAAAHDALVEADLALKSSPVSERLVMERVVLAMSRPRA